MPRRFMQRISDTDYRVDVGAPYRDTMKQCSLIPVVVAPLGRTGGLAAFEVPVSSVTAGSLREYLPAVREDDLRRLALEIRKSY